MAYSNEVVRLAQLRLASMKADRESENLHHLMDAYNRVPRIREIDAQLRRSMVLAVQAAFTSGDEGTMAMDKAKEDNLLLQQERQRLAAEHFAPGYLDETPICEKCGGSGYIGSTMCSCLRELCRQEQAKRLSLLADPNARFENFRLDYYSDRFDSKFGAAPRTLMEHALQVCRKYANQFDGQSGNLLFMGGTGLGKTFLSACIARTVAEKGFSVCYESASHLFAKLEKSKFNPDEQTQEQVAQIMTCDLLILDDLGTELPGNFVTAALYTLINDRILANKPMVVSTNFNAQELSQRYSPQIASRLQGNFKQLVFVGEDIRIMKNRGL